ncbi:M56 family metallopeptidase [Pedobacter sp. KBS0701]|uniref:M56 family metallopeptidase n=1 Tax=Pedobacter sp. KBS0701 TaxID=2578106 RepID=UPI00110D40F0|nr:M56 family metallopeptidase [Pedobacter sp. KBS0701]QDW25784.1 M56 family metallopeptidase [Pedobacter sp. KBS0701]
MGWLYYLLEANLYLILFYGFYRLFLHRETFYGLNRYYLIFSSILAFTLPFFQLGFLKKDIIANYNGLTHIQDAPPLFSAANVCLSVYIIICLVLSLKIFWGLRHIKRLMRNAKRRKENGITLIEINHSKMAFSFFNLLFIDPEMNQKDTVLKHEMVHIKQKHSIDILFFELIQISSWFNPVTYFIKNDIKLVHEYLADEATTCKDIAKYEYALFLIQNSYGNQEVTLSSQFFNSSLLKNRISMLNQKKSAKWARLKLLFILPLTGFMLCLSTMAFTKDYATIQFGQKKESLTIVFQDTTKKKADKKRLPPPPPKEPNQSKSKKVKEITINEAPITVDHKKEARRLPPPPPVEPGSLKSKKSSPPKVDQIRFAPPIVKKDKKNLPVPPPPPLVEPKTKKSGGK